MEREQGNILIIGLVLLLVVAGSAAAYFYFQNRQLQNQNTQLEIQNSRNKNTSIQDQTNPAAPTTVLPNGKKYSCDLYGSIPITQFLPVYTVKQADTLLSIAKNELGDTTRASEIAELNRLTGIYPNLSLTNPFLEIGWQLYLPPKTSRPTSGNIQAYAGTISRIETNKFILDFNGKGGGGVNVDGNTQFIFKPKEDYQPGDCVIQLEDVRTTGGSTIFVFPMDDRAFSYLKSG